MNPRSKDFPKIRVEVPFEITIVCGTNGLIMYPGGYRLSTKALNSKNRMLVRELDALVQQRREVDPLIIPRPRLKFLIERGGVQTYEDARRETVLSGLNWPVSIQVGETNLISFTGQEIWR